MRRTETTIASAINARRHDRVRFECACLWLGAILIERSPFGFFMPPPGSASHRNLRQQPGKTITWECVHEFVVHPLDGDLSGFNKGSAYVSGVGSLCVDQVTGTARRVYVRYAAPCRVSLGRFHSAKWSNPDTSVPDKTLRELP